MYTIKSFLRNCIPPILCRCYEKYIRKNADIHRYGFFGNYCSWDEAYKKCTGYDSDIILEKTKNALLKVKRGEAVYERDSVLFDDIQYSWPILAGLMWIAAQSKGELNVIDFGGSLGSTYFQNRKFLEGLSSVRWNIVEQRHFVDTGKKYFEDEQLKFYSDIKACLKESVPNTIILSSVVQYLENPYELLRKIKSYGFEYIIFDRTPFVQNGDDILTVQIVPEEIYAASYPCWFFGKKEFYAFFEEDYELIANFDALAGIMKITGNQYGFDKGIIFRQRRKNKDNGYYK